MRLSGPWRLRCATKKLGVSGSMPAELSATLDRLTDFKREHGAFLMSDLIYAIDLIGVKASRGAARYVARSKADPCRLITSSNACVGTRPCLRD